MTSEDRITVRHQSLRHAVELEDVIDEQLSNFSGSVWVTQRQKMRILCQLINYHQDACS